ncbi:muellerian-inhibiting factor isoform X2 [Melanotaenia boesemani]|uniref:muellerian-inhibiting factor isoform X2 n=1 Tax=Melanotaenia boesemani TaxID=1250792 RepID=UPI001C04B50E|nr:muellerian-inhibiting factor isoform X2 [Melanotaenia boesemani]
MLGAVVLMFFWTLHEQKLISSHRPAVSEHDFSSTIPASEALHTTPCFVDDIVAALREAVEDDSDLTNSSLTLFGVCTVSEISFHSVLPDLVEVTKRNKGGFEVLHLTAEVSEKDEQGTIMVTLDVPQSSLLKLSPVLLLAFESPLTGGGLDVTFTGQCLQPHTQVVCISEGTQYILLSGKPSEGDVEQKWRISVRPKSPSMEQNLKDILTGGKSGSNIHMTPLLLFSGERGTDTRQIEGSSQASFLCELRRFLDGVLPQDQTKSQPLRLDSLQSLPPLALGLSSSETLMAGVINSTAPTIFTFTGSSSKFPVRHGQLALSSELLEVLRQRLDQSEMQILEVINEEKVAHRAIERLGRLKELSAFQRKEPAAGESQYCAFLLLKALQTVAHAYNMQRRLRATRADPANPPRSSICGLRTLTVSFEKLLLGPHNANINNCHGSCTFPLTNGNNHAILLNYHTESGVTDVRAPCCVPVAYDPLEVLDLNEEGSFLSIKQDIIARECGCR